METVERILHNLFRRKKKKLSVGEAERREADKENVEDGGDSAEEPQRVTVKTAVIGESKTFPRKGPAPQPPAADCSPALPRWRQNPVTASATSLRGGTRPEQQPYDRGQWTSTQHFHLPPGTRPRHASGRGGAVSLHSLHRQQLARPGSATSLRPHTPVLEPHSNLRRAVEPYDRIAAEGGVQHWHLPQPRTPGQQRVVYSRAGRRGGMRQLVRELEAGPAQPGAASINSEDIIQLAHYPAARVSGPSPQEELPSIFPFSDHERKRRRSGSEDSQAGGDEEEVEEVEETDHSENKLRRNEETLNKIPSGIGKVFLDTIRKTEKIRSAKVQQMDPRSAARTPAANRVPKYRLRYDNPSWASPSRDTCHGRPWDSEEDVSHPVVLTSSGCASGCASDHLAPARSTRDLAAARSSCTLGRSAPSLATLRYSAPVRPGYTQTLASTMPHIRSVSGRNITGEVCGSEVSSEQGRGAASSSHSGVVTSVTNSFSWATLARYQERSLGSKNNSNKFFRKPDLKHKRTILDI